MKKKPIYCLNIFSPKNLCNTYFAYSLKQVSDNIFKNYQNKIDSSEDRIYKVSETKLVANSCKTLEKRANEINSSWLKEFNESRKF